MEKLILQRSMSAFALQKHLFAERKATIVRSWTEVSIAAWVVVALFFQTASYAQQHQHDHADGHNHGPKQAEFLSYLAATDAFKNAINDFKEQMKALRAVQIQYHNCDTKEQERALRRKYFEELQPMSDLHRKVLEAALQEFKSDPTSRAPLGHILFKSLKRNTDKDSFEGMLPIAAALNELKYPSPDLPLIYLRCCLAENDYQQARTVVDQNSQNIGNPTAILKQLDELTADWAEELEARKRDAEGEPLPQVKILTTKGAVVIELFENEAPEAVANFISLAEKGYFDTQDFFYVQDQAVAETGCPNEDGTGSPGYMIPDEHKKPDARKLFRGSVALALLAGRENSGGSVFFIPFLPGLDIEKNYTVFGRVVSGMPHLANLNRVKPARQDEAEEKKKEPKLDPDEVINVEIIRKRNHDYKPTQLPMH